MINRNKKYAVMHYVGGFGRGVKRIGRKILKSFLLWGERKLGCIYWLHIGDILTPCDGEITGGQYLVASRVFDIESIRSGNIPQWQNKLSEIVTKKTADEEQRKEANARWIRLVSSLDRRGFNPSVASLSMSDAPICLNNGTHRIAYIAFHNLNAYLPFERNEKDLRPWFPVHGEQYWIEKGLAENDVQLLKERYQLLIATIRTTLSGYVLKSLFDEVRPLMEEYGWIQSVKEFKLDDSVYVGVEWNLNKQYLYTKGRAICSKYIHKLSAELTQKFGTDWGYLAHSVTESVDLENRLEETLRMELKWE